MQVKCAVVLGVVMLAVGVGRATDTPTVTPTVTPTATGPSPTPTSTFVSQSCTFDGVQQGNDSTIQICIGEICLEPSNVAGEVNIGCGEEDQDAVRKCSCTIVNFSPVVITGIGVACVENVDTECPLGLQDCDGGTSVGIRLLANSQIGPCESHADCSSQCDEYCASEEKVQFNSGCESFCQGGDRNDLQCQCDTPGSTTCPLRVCSGTSAQGCEADGDCPAGETCRGPGQCSMSTKNCTTNADCPLFRQCPGDCDNDGFAKINELIIGVNIALGSASLRSCRSFDANSDRSVTINELIQGVNAALDGCPPRGEECSGPALGCPLGSCVGKDSEADRDCTCQCVNEAAGPAGGAGDLRCRLATSLRVEVNPPCNNVDVLVRLPPLCAPLTTATHEGVITNANENTSGAPPPDEIGPYAAMGNAIACSAIDSGATAGLKLTTNLAFFDSTIGDLISRLHFECQ